MKCELSSSGTEKRGKLETSKAIPNTERLTQPTTWSFGNAETLEAPGYCAIFFSIPWLFTQPQWLMVRNLFMFLIFFIPRTKWRLEIKCVLFLILRTTKYQLRELKRVYLLFLSYVRCMGERKQIMIILNMLIRIIKKELLRYSSLYLARTPQQYLRVT